MFYYFPEIVLLFKSSKFSKNENEFVLFLNSVLCCDLTKYSTITNWDYIKKHKFYENFKKMCIQSDENPIAIKTMYLDKIYISLNNWILSFFNAVSYTKFESVDLIHPSEFEMYTRRLLLYDKIDGSLKNSNYLAINGTAGVGKSSILKNAILKSEYPDAVINKLGQFGQFFTKCSVDSTMQFFNHSLSTIHSTKEMVYDRDFCNNWIWRIIMKLLADPNRAVHLMYQEFAKMPIDFFNELKNKDILILVNLNKNYIKKNMQTRNCGSDSYRACIKNYITFQNLVYSFFAAVCDFSCYNYSYKNLALKDEIEQKLVQKFNSFNKNNQLFVKRITGKRPYGDEMCYDYVKRIKIYK